MALRHVLYENRQYQQATNSLGMRGVQSLRQKVYRYRIDAGAFIRLLVGNR